MAVDFRDAFRSAATWEAVTADPAAAEEALAWLTDTIAHVSQQLSDAKADLAGGRLPDNEYRDLMGWRAGALNFRRIAESRKRALAAQVKRENARRSDEQATTQLCRLRAGLWKVCERYDGTPMAAEIRALMAGVEV